MYYISCIRKYCSFIEWAPGDLILVPLIEKYHVTNLRKQLTNSTFVLILNWSIVCMVVYRVWSCDIFQSEVPRSSCPGLIIWMINHFQSVSITFLTHIQIFHHKINKMYRFCQSLYFFEDIFDSKSTILFHNFYFFSFENFICVHAFFSFFFWWLFLCPTNTWVLFLVEVEK